MHKSILLLSVITLTCFSCNDNKTDTVKRNTISNSSLTTVSITGAVQPDQDCKQLERNHVALQKNYVALDSSRRELQLMFDAAIIRLDTLTGYNIELEKKLTERNNEILKLKQQVRTLSTKKAQ
jgi:hypothetical protein